MHNCLNGLIPNGYNEVGDLEQVKGSPFFYNALNLVYGVDGTGKSWQVVGLLKDSASEDTPVIYIDADGSNGRGFVKHCSTHNIEYVSLDNITITAEVGEEYAGMNNSLMKINFITDALLKKYSKAVLIVDSLTSILEGMKINNAEDISPMMYAINGFAHSTGYSVILIDHATEIKEKGQIINFKLEGNSSAKRRATASTVRYDPIDRSQPSKGGVFTCERSRNPDLVMKGQTFKVSNTDSVNEVIKFLSKKHNLIDGITQTDFTKLTKNPQQLWMKPYRDEIFNTVDKAKTKHLILKEEYHSVITN